LRIEQLILEDFRNYERAKVSFAEGINVVIGQNAQGKTNLLEAVHFLAGLGSPRAADAALVKGGAERAILHAETERRGRRLRLDLEIRPGRGTRVLVNRTPAPGVKSLTEAVSAVFFGPEELSLIKGGPDGRRRFLDDLVVKVRPARHDLRRDWDRVLRQRNALLRSMPREPRAAAGARDSLAVWDEGVVRVGSLLTAARLEVLGGLLPHARERYREIAGGGDLELGYSSSWLDDSISRKALAEGGVTDVSDVRAALAAALTEAREREIERGVSLVGPQRDDMAVLVISAASPDGRLLDARTFASQGDQRTCALALRLGERDLLAEVNGEQPILLLDDVFSELDPKRREWLGDAVRNMGQTIISSAEPGAVASAGAARVLRVEAGRITEGDS
jgi:DNA replication and repair protein RecF